MLGLLPRGIQIAGKTKKQIMEIIKKAPIKPRFKKFLQGETLGEAQIKPAIKGHKAVVPYELKAFAKGAGGALSLTAIYDALTSEMKTTPTKPKSGPMRISGRGVRNPSKTSEEAIDRKNVTTARPKPKPKKTLTQSQKDKIRGTFRTITVQKNDNISKIAKRAGVSRATLEKLNPKVKKNPDLIYPGQKIRIGGK